MANRHQHQRVAAKGSRGCAEPSSTHFDVCYKVLIIGESRTGKTSMIKRLDKQEFSEQTISTVGIDFVNAFFDVESSVVGGGGGGGDDEDNVRVKLQVWDTAGQERYHTLTRSYFRRAKGIVLAYDICDHDSFDRLEFWLDCILGMQLSNETIYLVGNKLDMAAQDREVSFKQAMQFANRNAIKFFETSAKTAVNLFETFSSLAADIFNINDFDKRNVIRAKQLRLHQQTTAVSDSAPPTSDAFVYDYSMPQEIVLRPLGNSTVTKNKRFKFGPFRRNKHKSHQQQQQQQKQRPPVPPPPLPTTATQKKLKQAAAVPFKEPQNKRASQFRIKSPADDSKVETNCCRLS